MFAQAIANEIDAEFFSITSSDLKSRWFGDTEKQIKKLFDEAKSHKVSIIFFDEFESIGVSRDKTEELTSSIVVPELLDQMQGFETNDNLLLIIAATNRPWDIDSALLRPGRFDSKIYIDLPNFDLRKQMFNKKLESITIEEDVIEYLASKTEMFNGADINHICDSLLRIVVNKEIEKSEYIDIRFEDCVEVLKKIKSSVSRGDIIKMNNFINSL
jgi:SpoVK/Ycf46/Vps4 family AAA+-type ATPase